MAHNAQIFALSDFVGERRLLVQRQIKALFGLEGWSGSDPDKWGIVANPELVSEALIPHTVVALLTVQDDIVIGTASIVPRDRKDLPFGPWLAGLIVHPSHRMEGLGTDLVQAIEDYARANLHLLPDQTLYLDTERTSQDDQPEWYERRGWLFFDETHRDLRSKIVMTKRLG